MVIQRWQTLLLLLGAITSAMLVGAPYATCQESSTLVTLSPVLLIVDILIAILAVTAIFLYRNLRLQIHVASVLILLTVALILGMAITIHGEAATPTLYAILPVVTFIANIFARRLMRRDQRLLASSDRLR
jgi:peptidoglycan/LPS O-acetylase OafA/YrhL